MRPLERHLRHRQGTTAANTVARPAAAQADMTASGTTSPGGADTTPGRRRPETITRAADMTTTAEAAADMITGQEKNTVGAMSAAVAIGMIITGRLLLQVRPPPPPPRPEEPRGVQEEDRHPPDLLAPGVQALEQLLPKLPTLDNLGVFV